MDAAVAQLRGCGELSDAELFVPTPAHLDVDGDVDDHALRQVRQRALLLPGDEDQLLPVDHSEALQRVHAADRVEVLARAVHLLRGLATRFPIITIL